jgi:hypothetical protein
VYDPVRHRLITMGGMSQTLQGGVWALTLSGTPTWTSLNPSGSGPGPIRWHSAIYDPMGDRVIVFGGGTGSGNEADDSSPHRSRTHWTPASLFRLWKVIGPHPDYSVWALTCLAIRLPGPEGPGRSPQGNYWLTIPCQFVRIVIVGG